MTRVSITLEYEDERIAKAVLMAIEPDNEGYAKTTLNGSCVNVLVESKGTGTLKNTIDDLMACATAAEKTARVCTEGRQ